MKRQKTKTKEELMIEAGWYQDKKGRWKAPKEEPVRTCYMEGNANFGKKSRNPRDLTHEVLHDNYDEESFGKE